MKTEQIERWYIKYGPMVFRRCRYLLADESAARDAVQEVFVLVLHHQKRINDEYPSSLLYRIATNVSLNMIRSRRRRNEVTENEMVLEMIAAEDDMFETVSRTTILQRIFSREPVSTRTMATYHFVDGMTLEETAREMHMSVSGVRKRLRVLQERLQSHGLLQGMSRDNRAYTKPLAR